MATSWGSPMDTGTNPSTPTGQVRDITVENLSGGLQNISLEETPKSRRSRGRLPLRVGGTKKALFGGVSQPVDGGVSQPVLGGVSQPVLGGVSQPVLGGVSQPVLGGVSPVHGGVSQPVLGGVSQPVEPRPASRLPNWVEEEVKCLIDFLLLYTDGKSWVSHKDAAFWNQAGIYIQQQAKMPYCRSGKLGYS